MFDRENIIGFLLLGLCIAIGGVLIWAIVTGERLRYTGPAWLAIVLMVLFFGGLLFGFFTGGGIGRWRRGGGNRWPDPGTGPRRRRWPWQRGQDEDRG